MGFESPPLLSEGSAFNPLTASAVLVLQDKTSYSRVLVNSLITVMGQSCQFNSRIRPVTLEMASLLLKQLVYSSETNRCFLEDKHLASVEVSHCNEKSHHPRATFSK